MIEEAIQDAVELVGHMDGGLDLVRPALTHLRVAADEVVAVAGAQMAEGENPLPNDDVGSCETGRQC